MKQTLRRLTALALALALSLGLVQTGQYAAAAQTAPKGTITYINPLYRDEMDAQDLVRPHLFASGETDPDSIPYCDTLAEAAAVLRPQLKKRTETVAIRYPASAYYDDLMVDIFDQAVSHTGSPTEGDYLRWQFGGLKGAIDGGYSAEGYTYTLTYTVTYYTTAAQEAEMDSAVSSLLRQLNLTGKNNYEKTRAIYDWLCSNITYDYDNLNDNTYKLKHTAYAALINRTSVCQGYAVLLYRLLLEEGIPCRLISGTANQGGHAWNIVKLGRSWYDLDATWDAPRAEVGYDYDYFLRCDANFTDHSRDTEYAAADFQSAYPMDSADFDLSRYTQLQKSDAQSHAWGDWQAVTPAACEATGLRSHTCAFCDVTEEETIPAAGHSWGDWTVAAPAACEQAGSETRTCSVCGKSETRTIPATGHHYVDKVTDPTCTEQGYTTHTCRDCGDQYTDSYVNAPGHRWDGGRVTDEATDEKDGVKTFTCTVCHLTRTEPIPATGHDYESAVTPPTCTEQGYTTHTCKTCGKTYVDSYVNALGHQMDEGAVTTEATCTQAGVKTFTCKRCSHTETEPVPATGHHYVDQVTPPTCTEQGYTTHTCPDCGDRYADSYTAATGHHMDQGTVTAEATCTQAGVKTFTCDRCDYTETQPIPAPGHHMDQGTVTAEATCTEAGVKTFTCDRCDYTETQPIPAPGHRYQTAVTEPTCLEEGEETFTCTVCGDRHTERIPAAGHHYTKAVTPPTCRSEGYTTYTCTDCGDRYESDFVDPLDHVWDEEGEVLTEPTYTAEGSILYRCIHCGEEVIHPLPKLTQKKNKVTVTKTFAKTASAKAQSFSLNAKATGGTLSYQSDNKSVTVSKAGKVTVAKNFVGSATITVTAAGEAYKTATAKVKVTASLSKVKLSSAKNVKGKKFTAKWAKNAVAAGYQLQYAADKDFTKGKKTVKLKKAKTVSATVKGLKKGKTYYVRVCAYQGSYTSPWSNVKTVKIKK
jgi:transglutaminase-like putative cysteine protease/DNA-directed RNA polymerase subunit RPC12/RpoP